MDSLRLVYLDKVVGLDDGDNDGRVFTKRGDGGLGYKMAPCSSCARRRDRDSTSHRLMQGHTLCCYRFVPLPFRACSPCLQGGNKPLTVHPEACHSRGGGWERNNGWWEREEHE